MAYLGNSPVLSAQTYQNIDDISGSFNGSTTSFALKVNGVAPVPFPTQTNQCLISVNGVIQKPDDTGASGFRISAGNIIFSSAPTGGQTFFGVILATADYVNAGSLFPDGTSSAPSITFEQDTDTGFFRSSSGAIGFTSNGVNTATLGSSSFTAPSFIPSSSSIPSNGLYLASGNNIAFATNSTQRLLIDSTGQIEAVSLGSAAAPTFSFTTDTNTGLYSPGADQVAITTGGTARLTANTTAISAALPIDFPLGTAGAPGVTFTGDLNTGLFSPGADVVAISAGGTSRFTVSTTGIAAALPFEYTAGTAGSPGIAFTGDLNTGIFSPGADQIGISTGGTQRVSVDASGDVTIAGGNVTLNARGDLRFADTDSSNWVAFQGPATVSSNVTWTLPATDGSSGQVLSTNGSGTLSWAAGGGTGDAVLVNNNAFTGANTFTNTTGQTFRQASSQDGILLRGRGGGTSSFTVEIVPAALSSSQTLTAPNTTGTIITTGDASTVTNTMLAGSISASKISGTAVTQGDTGTVTSTMIANNTIVDADINSSAGISDTKLGTISTAGKVSNSATTATSSNTGSAIVARDSSGNFSAGTITASLSGNATGLSGTPNITVGTVAATNFNATTSNFQFNSGYGSNATAYGCRAWVNFEGTSPYSIRSSGNVSSISFVTTGTYTVNLSTALTDTNYTVVCNSDNITTGSTSGTYCVPHNGTSPTTSTFRIRTLSSTPASINRDYVGVAVFR